MFKSVRIRVFAILAATAILAGAVSGVIGYWSNSERMETTLRTETAADRLIFDGLLENDREALEKVVTSVTQVDRFLDLLSKKDRDGLLKAAEGFFQTIRERYRLTHLYFIDTDGKVLLRVHNPPQHGDVLRRITFLEAQKTGKLASGIEMGKNFFSLRAVKPVSLNGTHIGYIEVGQEIDHIFPAFKKLTGDEVSVLLTNAFVSSSGADVESRDYNGFTLLDSSDIESTSAVLAALELSSGLAEPAYRETDAAGRFYAATISPFRDASGDAVGVLAISRDATAFRDQSIAGSINNLMVTLIIMVVVAVIIGALFNRLIARPVAMLTGVAERISYGELDHDITYTSSDEIGRLADSFRQMIAYIHGIARATGRLSEGDLTASVEPRSDKDLLSRNFNEAVESLREIAVRTTDAVANITASANETMAGVAEMSTSGQEQAAAVSETSTTIEELRQSGNEVADRAKEVSEIARSANEAADAGQAAIDDTVQGVQRINERIESIARSILSLSEQTQAVGKITSTVNDIAEQSKMLAFNASIEAAKAGEFGKGFAVVATEIRSLAEQSKTATGQIAEILADIQKAANQSVMVTEEGTKEAERGLRLAANSGERIRELADAIRTSAQTAIQIESATGQQARGMDQIVNAMVNIEEASTQAISTASVMEEAMKTIKDLADRLSSSVSVYQLD